jgi:hypothetical protein
MTDVRPLSKSLGDVQRYQHQRVIECYIADHAVPHDVAVLRFEGLKGFLWCVRRYLGKRWQPWRSIACGTPS